jgi:DNA-binding NtrC family response regulator
MTEESSRMEPRVKETGVPTAADKGQEGQRPLRVVAIDDESSMLDFYKAVLSGLAVSLECSTDPARGLELVREVDPDLVLLDLTMPGMDGLEVLRQIAARAYRARVVMVTGNYSIEMAVKAIQEGASDYVCKPLSVEKLRALIGQARQLASREERAEAIEKELIEVFSLEGLIGRSPRMLEVFDLIQRVGPHFRTAVITGETGTGKELVAQALHKLSPRRTKRFAVFNCGAIVETLVESQLFGHRKGAFTGAVADQVGLFEWADGGMVFLDEIGELSQPAQAKLLRVLENGEVQKLGAPQARRVDVLVIAATSRNLNEEVKSGRFRADLWYRLNMVHIQLPPLRDRREDVLLLARDFLERYKQQYGKDIHRFSRGAANVLLAYPWPGNVRELENAIARACMLARGKFIDREDLPEEVRNWSVASSGTPTSLEEAEKAALVRALAESKNKVLVARRLGISRSRLYRLMEKHGVEPDTEAAGN